MLVLHVGLTQFGVGFSVCRQADVLTQPTGLLDEVHVRHDLRSHLAKPLSVYGRYCHRDEEDEYLEGLSFIHQVLGVVNCVDGEIEECTCRAQVQIKWHKPTLNEAKCVPAQMAVHDKTGHKGDPYLHAPVGGEEQQLQ